MATKRWTKADAKKNLQQISALIAEAFNVQKPEVSQIPYFEGVAWEFQTEPVVVDTFAGQARICVTIDATFAHMAFRFLDPAAAVATGELCQRLNRHSGKWNSHEHAPHELRFWVEELAHDFNKVKAA